MSGTFQTRGELRETLAKFTPMSQLGYLWIRLATLLMLLATWTHAVLAQKPGAEGADKD